jgi:hypothetical protein
VLLVELLQSLERCFPNPMVHTKEFSALDTDEAKQQASPPQPSARRVLASNRIYIFFQTVIEFIVS